MVGPRCAPDNGFLHGRQGNVRGVLLLALPATLLALAGLLAFSAWVEERLISPQALILSTVRDRRSRPEHAEALVAREVELILSRTGR